MDEVHIATALPPSLARLLSARDGTLADKAWEEFVAAYSSLFLHTCRSVTRDRDTAMEGYAFVLEGLREDQFRRLRAYVPEPGTQFTTWLVVVTRRLLLDHHRHRYGRSRSDADPRRAQHLARRRLEDLAASAVDPDELATDAPAGMPDLVVRRGELSQALQSALEELTPSDRLLLALRFDDDRSVRDIAATMGLPTVFHVYRRLGTALSALKRALARRGVHEPEP